MVSVDSQAARADMPLDEDSGCWLRALRSQGTDRDAALAQLHELMVRAAHSEVRRRHTSGIITGPELDDLAHQAAADAMLTIIAKLNQFRGESRFTTWAYKFVMFEVSAKLGRHFWRNPGVALEPEHWEQLPDRFGLDPANESQWRELVAEIRSAVERELTQRQRTVFVAVVLNNIPLDALVLELDSNRNALYKTLFDARRKLRSALTARGYLTDGPSRRP